MKDLLEISIDDIETNIMSILYSNIDVKFSQFSLFNKLVVDKFDMEHNSFIHPNFKAKYLLVLRNLMSKYDDIIITKENKKYFIVCVSNKEKTEKYEEYDINIDNRDIEINLSKYIIEHDIINEFNYIDPYDGNTIYHDLVLSNDCEIVRKMIKDEKFDYFVFNKKNLTPIELSTNSLMTNIIILGIYDKMLNNNKKYKSIEKYVEYLESEKANIETIEDLIQLGKDYGTKLYSNKKIYFNILFLLFVTYILYFNF